MTQYQDTRDDAVEVIDGYSRAQAIEDGVLIDMSELAREAGIKYPVAVTAAVYAVLSPWGDGEKPEAGQALYGLGQSMQGRAWDMLAILLYGIRRGQGGDRVDFAPLFLMPGKGDKPRGVQMYALCGPGDDAEPVITVMMPGED